LGNAVRLPMPKPDLIGAETMMQAMFAKKGIKLDPDGKASLNDALKVAAKDNRELDEFRGKVGEGVQASLKKQFEKYDLTAQDWAALTKQDPKLGGSAASVYREDGSGL